jgi:hypothetical protein
MGAAELRKPTKIRESLASVFQSERSYESEAEISCGLTPVIDGALLERGHEV